MPPDQIPAALGTGVGRGRTGVSPGVRHSRSDPSHLCCCLGLEGSAHPLSTSVLVILPRPTQMSLPRGPPDRPEWAGPAAACLRCAMRLTHSPRHRHSSCHSCNITSHRTIIPFMSLSPSCGKIGDGRPATVPGTQVLSDCLVSVGDSGHILGFG